MTEDSLRKSRNATKAIQGELVQTLRELILLEEAEREWRRRVELRIGMLQETILELTNLAEACDGGSLKQKEYLESKHDCTHQIDGLNCALVIMDQEKHTRRIK